MVRMGKALFLVAFGIAGCACALAADPQFDAATIKAEPPAISGGSVAPGVRGGRFGEKNESLRALIAYAYAIPRFQVAGPDWLDSARFDIEARMPDGALPEEAPAMLRALLAERFHLKTHRESTEMSYYALVVAKGGFKLKEFKPGDPAPKLTFLPGGASMMTNGEVQKFAGALAGAAGRPVIDKTGLTGTYFMFVSYSPSGGEIGPDLFTAIQEQLGLKLEPQKGPVEILKVDRVDKTPVEN